MLDEKGEEKWIGRKKTVSVQYAKEKSGGIPYLAFTHLDACKLVAHGFSTKMGGVSKGHFAEMNLGVTRGDDPKAVEENYRRMGSAIGFECENLVLSQQTHTTNVRVVTEEDRGKGFSRERGYTDVDGLITNIPGLVLTTFYADCVPLYFVDPVHKAIGLSHSGWRGTVGRMGKVTLEAMKREYGTNPADVLAAIGPSICRDCYEVSEDVIEKFQAILPEECWPEIYDVKENGKYQLDLWKANERILLDAGILPEHLDITNICTCCNPTLLYSHRVTGEKRGNLAAFLMLKE